MDLLVHCALNESSMRLLQVKGILKNQPPVQRARPLWHWLEMRVCKLMDFGGGAVYIEMTKFLLGMIVG